MNKVAVIIPCYNTGAYLERTLQAVFAQTHKHLEIVCIDDGSQDNTAEILNKYEDRLIVLRHPGGGNRGQAESLNLGVRMSQSPYVAFLDADDLWHPGKIQEQVRILDTYPEIGLVYTNGDVIDTAGKPLYPLVPDLFEESNKPGGILIDCYLRTPSMVMVRRKILEQAGGFSPGLQSHDHDMWIRLSELTGFYFLNFNLTSYRKHPAQISRRRQQWEDGFVILRQAMCRYPYPSWVRRARLATLHYRLGEYDLAHKMMVRGLAHWALSGLYHPKKCVESIWKMMHGAIPPPLGYYTH